MPIDPPQNIVRSTQPLTNLTIRNAGGQRARATIYRKRGGAIDWVFPDAPPLQVDGADLEAGGEARQTVLAGLVDFDPAEVALLITVAIEIAKRAKVNDFEYFF